MERIPYEADEDRYLCEYYRRIGISVIARQLGRSKASVGNRAARLESKGLIQAERGTRSNAWTEEQDLYVEQNFGLVLDSELEDYLGRSLTAIRLRAWQLGVTKGENRSYQQQRTQYGGSEVLS